MSGGFGGHTGDVRGDLEPQWTPQDGKTVMHPGIGRRTGPLAAGTARGGRPSPPPHLLAEAERDRREVSQQLADLIASTRAVRRQYGTELDLFIHLYVTIRWADPTRAAALVAVAVLRLAHDSTDAVAHDRQCGLT